MTTLFQGIVVGLEEYTFTSTKTAHLLNQKKIPSVFSFLNYKLVAPIFGKGGNTRDETFVFGILCNYLLIS
jgi:hypothetical protein